MSEQASLFPEQTTQQVPNEVSDDVVAAIAAAGDRRNKQRGYDPNIREGFGVSGPVMPGEDLTADLRGYSPLPELRGEDPGTTSGRFEFGKPVPGSPSERAMKQGIGLAKRALGRE